MKRRRMSAPVMVGGLLMMVGFWFIAARCLVAAQTDDMYLLFAVVFVVLGMLGAVLTAREAEPR